jgi:hypothetical protein
MTHVQITNQLSYYCTAFHNRLATKKRYDLEMMCGRAGLQRFKHVSTVKHILLRAYIFGIWKALVTYFPADITVYIGKFYDYDCNYYCRRNELCFSFVTQMRLSPHEKRNEIYESYKSSCHTDEYDMLVEHYANFLLNYRSGISCRNGDF